MNSHTKSGANRVDIHGVTDDFKKTNILLHLQGKLPKGTVVIPNRDHLCFAKILLTCLLG